MASTRCRRPPRPLRVHGIRLPTLLRSSAPTRARPRLSCSRRPNSTRVHQRDNQQQHLPLRRASGRTLCRHRRDQGIPHPRRTTRRRAATAGRRRRALEEVRGSSSTTPRVRADIYRRSPRPRRLRRCNMYTAGAARTIMLGLWRRRRATTATAIATATASSAAHLCRTAPCLTTAEEHPRRRLRPRDHLRCPLAATHRTPCSPTQRPR